MKRTILAAIFLGLIGSSAGMIYENGSQPDYPDDRMHIMSGGSSSASGSVAVGPNGTEYRSELEMKRSGCLTGNQTDKVYNESFSTMESSPPKYKVEFNGMIKTPNPCYTVDHEITELDNNTFIMNVTTSSSGGLCTQCVGIVEYTASFTNKADIYDLEVRHNGEKVEKIEFPEPENSKEDEREQRNPFTGLMNWFRSLF